MTTWTLTCWNGKRYDLATPLAWRLEYGLGSPCDSFWVKFLWKDGQERLLSEGTRMTVFYQNQTVFFGVVDECQCQWSEAGCTAEISGRGMQALLLDNQAEAVDFTQASLTDILRRYVYPLGISLAKPVSVPGVWGYSVPSGSSCWKVLYQFARYYAGVTPRFDRRGKLLLTYWPNDKPIRLDETAPVTRLVARHKRYGVLSRVTVKDVTGWNRQTEVNASFQARGGQSSRVILMPKTTGYQARRYQAKFQLDRSAARLNQIEAELALPFAAWTGDLVYLARRELSRSRVYRVQESRVSLDEQGCRTVLVLGEPNAVL